MKKIATILLSAAIIAAPSLAEAPPEPPTESEDIERHVTCEDRSITVYFANTNAELTFPALNALEAQIDQLDDCAVTQIQTAAISTDVHSSDEMIKLSEARTDSVLESLAAAGVWAPEIQSDIVIARNMHRADTAAEPPARRVEVTLFTAPMITS